MTTCEISHKRTIGLNEDGSQIVQPYPPIKARVLFIGNENTGQNFEIKPGTPCLLLFSDREFNSYYHSGEVSSLSTYRMHDLSDSLCIPIIWGTSGTQDYNIFSDGDVNISGNIINLTAQKINIHGELIINGKPFLEHTHSNGNQGNPTGGVI